MAGFDRFMIAPFNIGLETDLKPWMIPDEAFAELNNAYVFRGRVRKRFGSTLMGTGWPTEDVAHLYSRLRTSILFYYNLPGGAAVGITDGAGAAAGTIATPYFLAATLGAKFVIGSQTFTVTALGAPAALTPSGGGAGTYNTNTGAYTFVGCNASTQIAFYPNPVGTTSAVGVITGSLPGNIFKVGQSFSIGAVIFTVVTAGAGVQMLRTDGSIEAATFDTATGAFSITIAALPNTQVYFYPSEPVMGLTQYESGTVNNQPTFGFDTQFAYNFTGGYWVRSGPAAVWHGTNLNFFWATNWTGVSADKTNLFVTNFYAANKNGAVVAATDDPIWVYDATTGWATFSPKFLVAGAGNIVSTARIVVPFKDRLLLLNTIEQDAAGTVNANYPNRCRFSHNGSPFPAATAWLEPNQVGADGAGWTDAPTEEEIVSAGFIKDRLIVYFERSTWELAYTGNQILPFVWQKLNTELGSEAEFSTVPFDKVVLTIGNTGVHACNGSNVERIDSAIPQEVFQIRDKDEGVSRVAGVRDYYTEMVYWTFPSANQPATQTYPNKVLVYNYRNNAWATNDDCITAFGFFEQQSDDTWADEDIQWQEADFAWDAGAIQSQFRQVIAGNQQGYTFIINTGVARNAPVMLITNMAYNAATGETTLTVLDHTLDAGEFIKIEHTANIPGIYKVNSIKSKDTIGIISADPGIYAGGGTVARVSNLSIKSKQWNPYVDKDFSFHLAKIDFNVDKTTHGEVTVDYAPSYSRISMLDDAYNSGALLGTGVLETRPLALVPLETVQDQLWHAVFLQTDGDSVQIIIKMSDDQMVDDNISSSGFELNAMILYTRKTSTRL